ncbi:transducin beta-like protein 3 isoform X2 [Rhinatrema bivittatum]|uniref:transducin beta-like protein 3 isoform X2 n=1 Tax=Rhinatrema bivittatum TaxID=194408 RepID=UPI00112CEC18|nr:transducin beta-like protein 3 isoform X2 [Rhinatrema bivittatum]
MDQSSAVRFKSNYAVSRKIEPFYKGGKIQMSRDGRNMFCTCGIRLNVLDVETGTVIHSIEQDDQEEITSFILSPDDEILVTGSRALLLKQWDWRENKCCRTWKAIHTAPVASMTFDPTSTLLATGGCDSTIKIWDVIKQYCTHNLKGSSGVVHIVEFHPDISQLQLFSSSMDYKIRIWDLKSSRCLVALESHYSAVTSLSFTADGATLLSSGRDKVCTVWDLKTQKPKRTIPVYESVEAAVVLPESGESQPPGVQNQGLHFITAGSKGILRIWEAGTSVCVYAQTLPSPSAKTTEEDTSEHSLTHCLLVPTRHELAAVTVEHNVLLYDLQTLQLRKQFAGYSEEVLDVKFLGTADSHIVVATNSPQLKVFELATSNCQILHGHTETVLAVDVFRKGLKFASCAKDRSVRIWQMDTSGRVTCVALGSGHAHGVGTVACSRLKETFIASGSQDCTVKIWKLPESLSTKMRGGKNLAPELLHAQVTEKGHDKDINSITVSPNDRLVATGSQDRTAKLWAVEDCSLLGVFRGHIRGIWCVQFSPMDQVLASSSADGTLKLWGLQDFSCLKTFEGHDASVLKVVFVSRGTQLLTSGSDGLLKLWTIKTNECVKTLDVHEDKIWGLHSNRQDNAMVTGSSDSSIVLWKDITEAELAEALAQQEQQIETQQELSNLLHAKKYVRALGLALSLDQPHTTLMVIKAILRETHGGGKLEKILLKLRQDQKESLLKYCATWNTNSRHCHEAQAVIGILLRRELPETLLQFSGIRAAVEVLIPYTERHMQRMGRLLQASMLLDFMWQNMRLSDAAAPRDEEMQSTPAPASTPE